MKMSAWNMGNQGTFEERPVGPKFEALLKSKLVGQTMEVEGKSAVLIKSVKIKGDVDFYLVRNTPRIGYEFDMTINENESDGYEVVFKDFDSTDLDAGHPDKKEFKAALVSIKSTISQVCDEIMNVMMTPKSQ